MLKLVTRFTICLMGVLSSLPTWAADSPVQSFSEPVQTIEVAAPEPGVVEEVKVVLGQHVKKGDPLVIMDRDVLLASLEIARAKADSTAEIEAARIQLHVKEDRVDKLRKLDRHGSEEELTKARADVDLAKTQVLAAEEKAQVDRLELRRIQCQLERRIVRSTIDGVVTKLYRQPGEFTPPSEPLLATVVRLDQLRVKLHIPTAKAVRLNANSELAIRFPETGDDAVARVDFLSPVTAADSGTVRVECLIANPEGKYRSGVRCHWNETADRPRQSAERKINDVRKE